MKKTIIYLFFLGFFDIGFSQITLPATQYSGHHTFFNPASVFDYDVLSVNLSAKKSWLNIPGSPMNIYSELIYPLSGGRHTVGLSFNRESIGPTASHYMHANYAYKLLLGESFLSFALQAGFLNYNLNWNKIDHVEDPEDPSFGKGISSWFDFDMNLGLLYQNPNFYAGFSVKHLNGARYGKMTLYDHQYSSQLRAQYFLMAGYYYGFTNQLGIRPELCVRYIHQTSTTVSLSLTGVYEDRFYLGISGDVLGKHLSFSAKMFITDHFRLGYAYELAFGPVGPYQKGSHEIFLSCFIFRKDK